jgi:hypothetical protein
MQLAGDGMDIFILLIPLGAFGLFIAFPFVIIGFMIIADLRAARKKPLRELEIVPMRLQQPQEKRFRHLPAIRASAINRRGRLMSQSMDARAILMNDLPLFFQNQIPKLTETG